MRYKILFLCLLALGLSGCSFVEVVTPTAPYVIFTETPAVTVAAGPTETPTPTPAPTPTPVLPTPTLAPTPQGALPRHGLIGACIIPVAALAFLWAVVETLVAIYTRPRGIDLSAIKIKAQDGLFIQTTVSITVRKLLTPVSFSISWPQLKSVAEKALEQELIDRALNFRTLDELERSLKIISRHFDTLSIVQELARDYGVEVIRFNIETRYPQETMDALTRRAYALVGGRAYLAYAAEAGLDPQSDECRELYRSYLMTSGQVDAARNFGVNAAQSLEGGLSSLVEWLSRKGQDEGEGGGSDAGS